MSRVCVNLKKSKRLFVLLEFDSKGPVHLYGPLAPRIVGVALEQ